MVLANGTVALVATVINDAVWKEGGEAQHHEDQLQFGSSAYQNFAIRFLTSEEEAVQASDLTSQLHVYEDTLRHQENMQDEFPF